jgi:DNA-binding NarL/FixJ family response regulator
LPPDDEPTQEDPGLRLTAPETRVLSLILRGLADKAIAAELDLAETSVK